MHQGKKINTKYNWINISSLTFAETHGDEVVEDLLDLHQKGAIDSVAFSLTYTPEGNPIINKAQDYMKLFRIMKEKLQGKMPVGALLQATMGHGWTPDSIADFTKVISPDGRAVYIFCPLDAQFRKYIYDSVRLTALEKPDFFMLDDDTRLITDHGGCFCKLHLDEFAGRTGSSWTREELLSAIETDSVIAHKYDDLLKESILIHAKNIRAAIDSVDPKIPCLFCTCSQDVRHAPDIARVLAAPGQELVVRINNARYRNDSPRSFAPWFHFTAVQLAAFPETFTLLAEPDTCPQNLYSTSCAVMNAQLTMSLLMGCRGGKIWITRLNAWEPGSGVNYRKTFIENAGRYHALAKMRILWTAPCVPMPEKPYFHISQKTMNPPTWADILSRMGLPFSFGKHPDRVVLLGESDSDHLSDAELKRILAGKVLMDGTTAIKLTKRGFSDLIGCRAAEWTKASVSIERLADGGTIKGNGNGLRADLSDLNPEAEVLSACFHQAYGLSNDMQNLSPGAIYFKNNLGGEVIICGKSTNLGYGFAPFIMLCETRKNFLIECLNRLDSLDLYIPEEVEVTLMTGICDNHRIFSFLNLGLDPVQPSFKGKWVSDFCGLEELMPDGSWKKVPERISENTMTLQKSFPALGVGVFRFLNKI